MRFPVYFSVIVIGGGHAGTEAALAASRMGAKTLLLTDDLETLGAMSCNPSIGGIGKGHLVREVDAMGGAMALCADSAGIQFRILNASKGPAVRATRAQMDRQLYKKAIRQRLENQPNLWLFAQSAESLIFQNGELKGVRAAFDVDFYGDAVVLTTGTFLNGLMHVGLTHKPGGRMGAKASLKLAENLAELDLPRGRLKTGTPPRLDGKTIDFAKCERQEGDTPIPVFSFVGKAESHPAQLPCWITETNEKTHEIIRQNLDRSPLYAGVIESVGPRYCPSIEDKIHRFATKNHHPIFLEPEGLNTHEFYPNGISTSLPFDVQLTVVQSIKGLENCRIVRPGYAIEYDFFDPRALFESLESKNIARLFLAGQINGTTGYEEAAAQGLLAGINAALSSKGEAPFTLKRYESYLGVMVDDLITQGVLDPYRMFTSRAEYRLSLREDNADRRLTPKARALGLVDDTRWQQFCEKEEAILREKERLKKTWINPKIIESQQAAQKLGEALSRESNLFDFLRRPNVRYADLFLFPQDCEPLSDPKSIEQLEIEAKYAGYIERQAAEIERAARMGDEEIPAQFNYDAVKGLSAEVRQKLKLHRPQTIAQALRISGVTPAAISILLIYLKKSGLI